MQAINWEAWADLQNQFERRDESAGKIGKGKEILVKEEDVLNMTPDQMDEYMDWYETSWLDSSSKGANPLHSLFPLGSSTRETGQSAPTAQDDEEGSVDWLLGTAQQYLRTRDVVNSSDPDIPRPGSLYTRYRQESDLPDTARAFYETAARVVGVPLSTLVRCVSQGEIQINKWLEDQRRIKHFADRENDSMGDADEMEGLEDAGDVGIYKIDG